MFNNIGEKIKGFAKAAFCVEVIAAIVCAIVLYSEYEEFWCILIALGGIPTVWILSMLIYGFGEMIVKLTEIERNTARLVIGEKTRLAKEKAVEEQAALRKAQDEKKAREAQRAAQVQQAKPTNPAAQSVPAPQNVSDAKQDVPVAAEDTMNEQTLAEKLQYALRFSTDHGMVKYLRTVEDERVRNILNVPEEKVRELVVNLLNSL